jgi:uncharacterized heparinase superfamily protein
MSRMGLTLRALAQAVRNGWQALRNRWSARLSRFAPPPPAYLWQPEPKAIGSFARAHQYAAGNFLFAGQLVQHKGSPWDLAPPSPAFAADLHGFAWLDDLAADGSARSRELAQAWTMDWIALHRGGSGPGWTPELAGRRLIRWISHTPFLLKGMPGDGSRRFFRALGGQVRYLTARWRAAPDGLARIEALTGLVYASLSLEGRAGFLPGAIHDLGRACERDIAADGGIASRNPEALAEVFTLLVWAARTLEEADKQPDPRHLAALSRIAPALRALRMGDGGLARFHGGSTGPEGRLDQALADGRVRGTARGGPVMGFQRLAAGPMLCMMDAGRPPAGATGHASTLGIEVTVGRHPLIGSIGPGAGFGPEWVEASRLSGAHSTLTIERKSSSSILEGGLPARILGPILTQRPGNVASERTDDVNGAWILAAHDGYADSYGLIHERRLHLATSGLDLRGEDTLSAQTDPQKRIFDRMVAAAPRLGVAFSLYFHLHPDVDAKLALARSAIALAWPSGETWVFRQSGGALELQPSVWLDRGHLKPRATKLIVVTGRVVNYAGRVTWALKRAEEGRRRTVEAAADADQPA